MTAKFMLMMNAPGSGPYQIAQWPTKDIQAHMAFMKAFAELTRTGELAGGEGLAGPDQAKLVRADASGAPQTDGVFPESKEFLAGYWIVEVDSAQRAYEIAARASMAPGPGGAPLHLPIEVREVLSLAPAQ
jgi:hypothetical protein